MNPFVTVTLTAGLEGEFVASSSTTGVKRSIEAFYASGTTKSL
jgi:hypothetical protein